MVQTIRHLTGAAKPGPPNDRGPAPAGPPPPWWRMWLLPLGIFITLLIFVVPHMTGPTTKNLSYSKFVSEVTAGDVKTASVNPGGAISGSLKGGDDYTSQIPTAIDDTSLAPALKTHNVDVTGVGAGSALLGDLLSFLPSAALRRLLHLDRPAKRQAAGRGDHGLRRLQGQGLRRREADDPLLRHRRLRGLQARGRRSGRLPQHPERYAAAGAVGPRGVLMVGPAGHRQDPDGPGRGGRGRGAFPRPDRLELRRAVRGRRRLSGQRPVCGCPQASPFDHLHRRDRRHRPAPRWLGFRPQRRARADPQPAAGRDGRLRPEHRRRRHGRHQPARDPRPGAASSRSLRPRRWRSRCPTRPSAPRSWPSTPRASIWAPTSISTPWPGAPRDFRAPTWPT